MPKLKCRPEDVYEKIISKFFNGELKPGTKLVEQSLADEFGVSRVPIRETLNRLVAEGVLIATDKRSSVRVRLYTPEQVQQLYQYREMIEGGTARYAASFASDSQITKMELINEKMKSEIGNYGSKLWGELDYNFHMCIAEASRNERFISALKTLLRESYYVFYLHPAQDGISKAIDKNTKKVRMQKVVDDHAQLLKHIKNRDSDSAEKKARNDMQESGKRAFKETLNYQFETK